MHLPLYAQHLTTKELIKAWKASDTSQTTKAEATYYDLRVNKNLPAYTQRLKELEDYLQDNPNKRLQIRTDIYTILGKRELNIPATPNDQSKLKKDIAITALLNDKQLLSEVYTLYAGLANDSSVEHFLLYIMKAIDIQHQIGDEHFPLIYLRYLNVSISLYFVTDYSQSINYGLHSLQLMNMSETSFKDSILQMDMLGASYKALNKPDSTIFFYKKIQQLISYHNSMSAAHGHFSKGDTNYVKIWTGIATGGVGQGLFLEKRYEEAYPLLLQNVISSVALNQLGDASIAQNTLAEINFIRKQYDSSLYKSKLAYAWASGNNDLNNTIIALKTITDNYKALGNYDSAFFYNEKYHVYNDTLQTHRNKSLITTINARIQFENMQANLENAKTTITNSVRLRNYLLISIILLTVIALLLYNRYRLRQNIRQKQLEKEKAIAEAEIEISKQKIHDAQKQIDLFTRNISEKNKLIETLQTKFGTEIEETANELKDFTILTEDDWHTFKLTFEKAFPGYLERLAKQMPNLTQAEQRFMTLAKIGLTNKEMAAATGVSPQSIRVTIFRLRKKLNLPETDDIRSIAQNI
ncbi:MAG: LuxR C-terminal-related transcriptional regulator [Arachidicoccus sp.]|nr:LuxR C-terminal-related transcriptional regulator [Arachidicoccus sp.]